MRDLHIQDPLSMRVNEFDALLRLLAKGNIVRESASDPCRAFVNEVTNGSGSR